MVALHRLQTSLYEKAASSTRMLAAGDCHDFEPQCKQQAQMELAGAKLADCPPNTIFKHTQPVRRIARSLPAGAWVAVVAVSMCMAAQAQQARLVVAAFDERSGEPIAGLSAADFAVTDGDTQLRVEAAERFEGTLDLMLVLDTSMIGETVRPMALPMINALAEGDQMALVGYDQAATLLQDFTSSKDLLRKGVMGVRYGNNPRGLDALFAVLDGGFENAVGRRAAVLLSAGAEGASRTSLGDLYALARRRGVQVFCVYAEGADQGTYQKLARNTGGAYFFAKKLDLKPAELAELLYRNLRSSYELTVSGAYTLGSRVEVEVLHAPENVRKAVASALVLE